MDKVLFVASTGGHLAELHQLRHQVGGSAGRHWVTFESDQSRSLLADESVTVLDEVAPRGYAALLMNLPKALRIIRDQRPQRVVSTGSGIALAFLPFAILARAEAVYIESAARTRRPSLTGRLLSLLPWVRVYTQYVDNTTRRWRYRWSIFDGWVGAENAPQPTPDRAPKVLVMLGTLDYSFERLVDSLLDAAPRNTTFVWQLGSTTPQRELPGRSFQVIESTELQQVARDSTMIVSHAGVGSALVALHAGIKPILVPRRAAHGEHVDDHQVEVAQLLDDRGLATQVEADSVVAELFEFDYRTHLSRTA